MKRWLTMVLAAVIALAVPRAAGADARSDAEAKKLWLAGTNAYNLGEFTEAIKNYKAAYKLKADPVFLYNIAQSYRLSKDLEQALFFYKSYLRNAVDSKIKLQNRKEVEDRIAELEQQLAQQQKVVSKPPNDPAQPDPDSEPTSEPTTEPATDIPSPEEAAEAGSEEAPPPTAPAAVDTGGSRPIYKKWWFWAGVGVVAVGATVAIVAASGGGSGAPDSEFGTSKVF